MHYAIILNRARSPSSKPCEQKSSRLDDELGLGSAGTGVGRVLVTRELYLLGAGQSEDLLEPLADLLQPLLALLGVGALNGGLALGLLASGGGSRDRHARRPCGC